MANIGDKQRKSNMWIIVAPKKKTKAKEKNKTITQKEFPQIKIKKL